MDYTDFTLRKAESLRAQINHIECVDFPYPAPRRALDFLGRILVEHIALLGDAQANGDNDSTNAACKAINSRIVEFHTILGFLLRATNIRNSFEIYAPLRDLAHQLLDHKPHVVLSSEWEFSPFTYPTASRYLPDFVFIGLPASEAGNALILPLAGHELGHSVWQHGGVGQEMNHHISSTVMTCYLNYSDDFKAIFGEDCNVETLLNNQMVLHNLSLACRIAGRQCEEIFCDALGVRLFGEAFLDSFEYLIIPSLGGARSELYPPLRCRIFYMVRAAKVLGCKLEYQHQPPVLETDRVLPAREQFAVAMADAAANSLFESILKSVREYADERQIAEVDPDRVNAIASSFESCVPATEAGSVANIVNAGWVMYRRFNQFLPSVPDPAEKFSILCNLLFKSMEVFEYERRINKE